MGAFNTISVTAECPFCKHSQDWTVQFKYGDCWQYSYRIGDKLRWGGNDKGENVGGKVRTDGISSEPCEICKTVGVEATVYFIDNVIEKVELSQERLNIPDDEYFEKLD